MNLNDILNPSTIIGALLISIIGGFIVFFFTKDDNQSKKNSIKTKDNHGFIFQDTKIEGEFNVKSKNKE
ncbi:MAG: hypothetical protein N4A57_08050 [Anaeromicrobium sp.]|jgi:uncharacterized membrane protein YraQ (UPF0718 family)|uniref:hypothetical protein n=1 Tax=Anaeromicrobium sp. TaxID=1929132 RepID=UPI0025EEDE4D|nr:hypothetical protein [Anaeromicrobium sp.]MCT4594203.1 hypothetical protein [Anaeromicrobium sp.]